MVLENIFTFSPKTEQRAITGRKRGLWEKALAGEARCLGSIRSSTAAFPKDSGQVAHGLQQVLRFPHLQSSDNGASPSPGSPQHHNPPQCHVCIPHLALRSPRFHQALAMVLLQGKYCEPRQPHILDSLTFQSTVPIKYAHI